MEFLTGDFLKERMRFQLTNQMTVFTGQLWAYWNVFNTFNNS